MTTRPHLGYLNLKAQGDYKRVLFVCTGGMLRSATAAHMMAAVADWNTRCAGIMDGALPTINETLVEWAEDIYCMTSEHSEYVTQSFPWAAGKVKTLNIEGRYHYRDPELINILYDKFEAVIKEVAKRESP